MLFPDEAEQDCTKPSAMVGQQATPSHSRQTCKELSVDGMLPNPQDLRQSPAKLVQSDAFYLSDSSSIFKHNISESLSRVPSQPEKTFRAPH